MSGLREYRAQASMLSVGTILTPGGGRLAETDGTNVAAIHNATR